MLVRYRRVGGFKQLLALVETSVPAKRAVLMKAIEQEDKRWAGELTKRLLTIDKVILWPVEAIEQIVRGIPVQTWPKAFFHLPEDVRLGLLKGLLQFENHHKQIEILDMISALKPTQGEIETAHVLIFKRIRELQASGELKPEKWDPDLSVEGLDKDLI